MRRKGLRLQCSKSVRQMGHVPISLRFYYILWFDAESVQRQKRLRQDKVMAAWFRGTNLLAYLMCRSSEFENKDDECMQAIRVADVDKCYQMIVDATSVSAAEYLRILEVLVCAPGFNVLASPFCDAMTLSQS